MDIYIYYKVKSGDAENLQQKILTLQAMLSDRRQVQTALKQRIDTRQPADSLQTWMEIYLDAPHDFLSALEKAIDDCDARSMIAGERHVEFFTDMFACA